MYLKRFIFVNWGGLPNQAFDFGPINLLTGGNGSGKTTAADAIQTVMTAAHDTLFTYNPGQEETSQRGRGGKQMRTMASYVLGCDDGSYARPWRTDGYLAAVFHPTPGELAAPFTAVIGSRAMLDAAGSSRQARLQDNLYVILSGQQLGLDNFQLTKDDGEEHVVALKEFYPAMVKKFGKQLVERYDTKKAYLGRFYGALRGANGRVSEREAMVAARTFSGFMAYKPHKQGIHAFVANEILEKRDQGEIIRSVSGLMKNIHAMEQDARNLCKSVELLSGARQQSDTYINNWVGLREGQYVHAKARYLADQRRYLKAGRDRDRLKESLKENETAQRANEQRQRELQMAIDELNAERLGVASLRDKDRLNTQIADAEQELSRLQQPLLNQVEILQKNRRAAELLRDLRKSNEVGAEIAGLKSESVATAISELLRMPEADESIERLFVRDWVGEQSYESELQSARLRQSCHLRFYNELHSSGDSGDSSLRDQIVQYRDRQQAMGQQLGKQMARKQSEVEALANRQVSYPPGVVEAVQMLQRQCPEADARVLCDYVEITNTHWQGAIEGYLGGSRFAILVAPEWEAEAIRLVRAMPGRNQRARVIQGDKAKRDYQRLKGKLPEKSILKVMNFTHKVAEYYIGASFGTVERVGSADSLRHTRRGITADGMGSGSYSLFRCDISDAELVFGHDARDRALAAKQKELDSMAAQMQEMHQAWGRARELTHIVDSCELLTQADLMEGLVAQWRHIIDSEQQLRQLDSQDSGDLEQRLEEKRQLREEIQTQEKALLEAAGALKKELEQTLSEVDKLNEQQDRTLELAETAEAALSTISKLRPEYNYHQRLEEVESVAADSDPRLLEQKIEQIQGELRSDVYALDKAVQAHNACCQPDDSIVFSPNYQKEREEQSFAEICKLQHLIDEVQNRLQNNVLIEKYENVAELKTSFYTAFVSNLCHGIYQAIKEGERTLENLNEELVNHRFGADQEVYYFRWDWMPEFRDYWRFFDEIIKQPQLGESIELDELMLSQKSRQVLDRLVEMLLDEDEQKAYRELERIADYRNYRKYEIYKEPKGKAPIPLSQYGTGSGGQSETPFYIIRSAAITSAFRFKEGHSHLRMVLVDEAFSRMDETRSREVIDYLTNTLGLQLMFVMPSSKSGTFMDLVTNQFVFAKCPVSEKIGELGTQVFVDRQQLNQEKVSDLWIQHKESLYNQATFDFMDDVLESTAEP